MLQRSLTPINEQVWSIVVANQQTHVTSANPIMLVKGTAEPVQVANNDFYVDSGGNLVSRNPTAAANPSTRRRLLQSDETVHVPVLGTATATKTLTGGDDPMENVPIYVSFTEPSSQTVFKVKVNGFAMKSTTDMFLFTDIGAVHFDGANVVPLNGSFSAYYDALSALNGTVNGSSRRKLLQTSGGSVTATTTTSTTTPITTTTAATTPVLGAYSPLGDGRSATGDYCPPGTYITNGTADFNSFKPPAVPGQTAGQSIVVAGGRV